MLLLEGSSEMRLFRYLSNHIFRSLWVQKYVSYEHHIFLKMFEIQFKFWKSKKNQEEYLSLPVNGLTNIRKILHITKKHFFLLNFLHDVAIDCLY